MLQDYGTKLEIHRVEQQLLADNKVSSTVIRQKVKEGDMELSAKLLAHPYLIIAEVDSKGNIYNINENKLLPPAGQYEAIIQDADIYKILTDNKISELSKVLVNINNDRTLKINNFNKASKVLLEIARRK